MLVLKKIIALNTVALMTLTTVGPIQASEIQDSVQIQEWAPLPLDKAKVAHEQSIQIIQQKNTLNAIMNPSVPIASVDAGPAPSHITKRPVLTIQPPAKISPTVERPWMNGIGIPGDSAHDPMMVFSTENEVAISQWNDKGSTRRSVNLETGNITVIQQPSYTTNAGYDTTYGYYWGKEGFAPSPTIIQYKPGDEGWAKEFKLIEDNLRYADEVLNKNPDDKNIPVVQKARIRLEELFKRVNPEIYIPGDKNIPAMRVTVDSRTVTIKVNGRQTSVDRVLGIMKISSYCDPQDCVSTMGIEVIKPGSDKWKTLMAKTIIQLQIGANRLLKNRQFEQALKIQEAVKDLKKIVADNARKPIEPIHTGGATLSSNVTVTLNK